MACTSASANCPTPSLPCLSLRSHPAHHRPDRSASLRLLWQLGWEWSWWIISGPWKSLRGSEMARSMQWHPPTHRGGRANLHVIEPESNAQSLEVRSSSTGKVGRCMYVVPTSKVRSICNIHQIQHLSCPNSIALCVATFKKALATNLDPPCGSKHLHRAQ